MAIRKVASAPEPTVDPHNPSIHRWPECGLILIHDFITEAEEATMITAFHAGDPQTPGPFTSRRSPRRISQHFGYHFDYTTFGASETTFTPVPEYMTRLLPRLPVQEYLPDQFTTQYYPPGAGIPPHVDTHSMFREALYSLSFGSDVPMMFRKANGGDAKRMRVPKRSLQVAEGEAAGTGTGTGGSAPGCAGAAEDTSALVPASTGLENEEESETWELMLPRRSLLVMTGPSRYGYIHGIRSRKTDQVDGRTVPRRGRYSLTMRTIVRGEDMKCDCAYPGICDARIREEMGES